MKFAGAFGHGAEYSGGAPGSPPGYNPRGMTGPHHDAGREAAELRTDSHPRTFGTNRYVYAVLSRRARGVSIGINVNPDKACNFACVYCQVDRTVPPAVTGVDEGRLLEELEAMLAAAAAGRLAELAAVDGVPPALRRVADVAFSGDGEPTSWPGWPELVPRVGELLERYLPGVPMTLITNASLFHLERVRRGLDALAARGGRVWAKLDAGTEERFHHVNGTTIPFARVLDNIRGEARRRPVVVQSLFFREAGVAPAREEIEAWAARLAEIRAAGGTIAEVQVTTVARRPPSPEITALSPGELEEIAAAARRALPGSRVETWPARPEDGR